MFRGIDLTQVARSLSQSPILPLGSSFFLLSQRPCEFWVAKACNHFRSVMAEEPKGNRLFLVRNYDFHFVDWIGHQ